ncbi:MAG: zinc ABC transporter substrate-binding protein [Planctomycetota bacterium]
MYGRNWARSGRTVVMIAAAIAIMSVFSGCRGEPGNTDDAVGDAVGNTGPYTIVSTVGMVTDVVDQVAGDRATVTGIMGSGVDPHLYKPTRSDVQVLLDADIVFYCGLLLEGRMTDTLIRAASSGKKVHAVTEMLDEQYLLEPEEFEGLNDPHVWMDPSAWVRAVDVVRDALIDFDPDGAAIYTANAAAYSEQLAALDAYAEDVLASVPESQRVLITAHDAFNYFGRRFGYEVVGIQGLSTESEAGVQDIERLVDLIVERGIDAVFIESTVSERNINALIEGARARGHDVRVGGELFSDAMGENGTYEGTYIGMVDHNVTTISRALGGDAPPRGMHERLAE